MVRLDGNVCLCPTRELNRRGYPGIAFLKLTSGSTALPKAAIASEAQLVADSDADRGRHGHPAGRRADRHDPDLARVRPRQPVMPLLLQGTPIVLRDSFVPHQLLADAAAFGARIFHGVPFMFQFLVCAIRRLDGRLSLHAR